MAFPFPRLHKVFFFGLTFCLSWQASAQSSRTVICCEGDHGRPVCGDVLPSACYGRAYREMTPSGIVLRYVAAPLTPEEAAERRALAKRQKEENEQALIQRRLDRTLIEMYSSSEDIDLSEKRALNDLEKDLNDLRVHELELRKREATLQHETQLYSDTEMPKKLSQELDSVTKERNSYRTLISSKEAEHNAIKERYANDRKRYAELMKERSK